MKTLPSKELFREVLGIDVKFIEFDIETIKRIIHGSARDNDIYYHDGKWKFINIYELAHKCKEWAKLKHFIDIDSHSCCARWGAKAESHNGRPSVFYEQVFIGRTETDAIFKSCEWIMEQTK